MHLLYNFLLLSLVILMMCDSDMRSLSVTLSNNMKKRSERRKHCVPATVPHRRTESAMDCQNLISWRWSLPAPTDPVWWRSMHTILSYRGNRHRPPQTHRQDRLQYTAPLPSAQCKKPLLSSCQLHLVTKYRKSWNIKVHNTKTTHKKLYIYIV